MLRVVLPPLVTAYAIFVAMVVLAIRRPVPRPRGRATRSVGSGPRRVLGTIVGGYAAFLLLVLIFQAWIAGDPGAFRSALWGGAFLCGVSLVLAAGASWLARRTRG